MIYSPLATGNPEWNELSGETLRILKLPWLLCTSKPSSWTVGSDVSEPFNPNVCRALMGPLALLFDGEAAIRRIFCVDWKAILYYTAKIRQYNN